MRFPSSFTDSRLRVLRIPLSRFASFHHEAIVSFDEDIKRSCGSTLDSLRKDDGKTRLLERKFDELDIDFLIGFSWQYETRGSDVTFDCHHGPNEVKWSCDCINSLWVFSLISYLVLWQQSASLRYRPYSGRLLPAREHSRNFDYRIHQLFDDKRLRGSTICDLCSSMCWISSSEELWLNLVLREFYRRQQAIGTDGRNDIQIDESFEERPDNHNPRVLRLPYSSDGFDRLLIDCLPEPSETSASSMPTIQFSIRCVRQHSRCRLGRRDSHVLIMLFQCLGNKTKKY